MFNNMLKCIIKCFKRQTREEKLKAMYEQNKLHKLKQEADKIATTVQMINKQVE